MDIVMLTGTYRVLDFKNRNLARSYELVLGHDAAAGAVFTLKSTLSGPWGSRGTEWRGGARLEADRLLLASETVNHWSFTVVEEDRIDDVRESSTVFLIQVAGDGSQGLLLPIDDHEVRLVKNVEG